MCEEQPHTQKFITHNNFKVWLVGTAHISQKSAEEVAETIEENRPNCVCVELDTTRFKALSEDSQWQKIDIRQIIKRKEGVLLFVSLLLSNFQQRIGAKLNAEPGLEMKKAIEIAKTHAIPVVSCDRNIRTTLLRVWRLSKLRDKLRLLGMLISFAFEKQTIGEEEVEALKHEDALNTIFENFARHFPLFKKILLEERDQYLAYKIYHALQLHKSAVVVIGAGHLNGVHAHLNRLLSAKISTEDEIAKETEELDRIPKISFWSRAIRLCIPLFLLAFIVSGFFFGGQERGLQNITYWILANGIAASIGSIFALAHPVTIVSSFVFAPLTSLNPTIGVGFVAALIQSLVKKPRVRDLQHMKRESRTISGFYQNRVTKILLVFILSSIGSSIGTFVALPLLIGG